MAVLGPRFCARAFSSCGEWGPLFITVCGPLTITASLVVEHKLQTCRLSICGSRAQLLCSMWDLPRPGLEPMSPALAGRFSTTAPPGKPHPLIFSLYVSLSLKWVTCRQRIYRSYFCIHSAVYGHLGNFHVLVIVNSAAMNIVVHDIFSFIN